MIANVLVMIRKRSRTVIGAALLGCCFMTPQPALAADCAGNPNALGTSRTLVVDPMEHPRIGTMQYPETLPLADHEVVLYEAAQLPIDAPRMDRLALADLPSAHYEEYTTLVIPALSVPRRVQAGA